MNGTRVFLGLAALVWLPYGVLCFIEPAFLDEAAGLSAATATATTELRAMYGGLQVAIGCFVLAAAIRPELVRPALLMLAFLCTGLALGRLGGVFADGDLTQYTLFGLVFEIASSSIAIAILSRGRALARA